MSTVPHSVIPPAIPSANPFARMDIDVELPVSGAAELDAQPSSTSRQASTYFSDLITRARSGQEMVRSTANYLLRCGIQGVWIVPRSAREHWQTPVPLVEGQGAVLEIVSGTMHSTLESWNREGQKPALTIAPLRELPSCVLIVAPVIVNDRLTDALITLAPTTSRSGIPLDWVVAHAAASLAQWQAQAFCRAAKSGATTANGLLGLFASLNSAASDTESRICYVNDLKTLTQADHVGLALFGKRNTARLVAVSDVEHLDAESVSAQLVESFAHRLPDHPLIWRKAAGAVSEGHGEMPASELDEWCNAFHMEALALVPIREPGNKLAGWSIHGYRAAERIDESLMKQVEQVVAMAGTHLCIIRRGHRSAVRIAFDNCRKLLAARGWRIAGVATAAALLFLLIPMPYRIGCDCRLEPFSRRYIAAPWDGMLDKSGVNTGDVVESGQVVALMDARQLRMELSSLEAELESQRKQRDSMLARGNVAESQIAASEMTRLESKIAILNNRLSNTEIRSPIGGVVVSGDLDKAEGVPMETGQTLFEIAPLDKMCVEVLIPEQEVRFVSPGAAVHFEFDAFPFRTFEGTLVRLHPRAEIVDAKNVFVGEIEIANPEGLLRPGMKGRARVRGGRYPLGWNLFHHSWDSARRWLVW
jgi:RND family efflux transporter MFP subunit